MKQIIFALLLVLLVSSVSAAQEADIEALAPFGAISFQEYVDKIVERSRTKKAPNKTRLRDYQSSWNYTIKAAIKFKESYDHYKSEYGLLDGMNPPSYYLDYMRDKVKRKRNRFVGADIDKAHKGYVSQYTTVVRERKKAREEEENRRIREEQEAQRPEALVFGVLLHSATKDQLAKVIKEAGGQLIEDDVDKNKLRFDAKPFVPAAKQLVVTYTNENRVSSYAYSDLSQQAANDLAQTLTAKYGQAYFNDKGMAQWNLKNDVIITFLLNSKDPLNPNFVLVYQTKLIAQYIQEEQARRQKVADKDATRRKGNQAL